MARYDHGGGCACGLYKECTPECKYYKKPSTKPSLNPLDYPIKKPSTESSFNPLDYHMYSYVVSSYLPVNLPIPSRGKYTVAIIDNNQNVTIKTHVANPYNGEK